MQAWDRRVQIAAALIIIAGLGASGLAVFADALGVGAAPGEFGWKRITLVAAGGVVFAAGVLLLVRPRVASRLVNWAAMGPRDRELRITGGQLLATGIAASGLAIFADELGVGAAPGEFGWKGISLLVVGGVIFTAGALLLARPQVVSSRIDSKRLDDYLKRLSHRYPVYLAIGLLGVLGVVLVWTRLSHITASLWHDEAVAAMTFGEVGTALKNPAGHVLYDVLSSGTVNLLGESEAMRRFWSVAPAIAAVGFAAWWAWRRIGIVAAVAFAALAVAAPLHLDVAPQARGYGLALLAATLMLITADRLSRAHSKRMLLGFLGAGVVGISTLIFFAFSFIGQSISLLRWPALRLSVVSAVATACLLSLLLYAPVLTPYLKSLAPFLESEADSPAGAWNEVILGDTYISLTAALLLEHSLDWLVVPIATLLTVDESTILIADPLAPDWAAIAALGLIAVALVALWLRKDAGLALILILPPLAFNLGFSIGDFSTVARHQLLLLPHVLLLVAIGIAELGGLVTRFRVLSPIVIGAGVFIVLALANATVQEEQKRALPRENFKEVANVARGTEISPIVTDHGATEGLVYYLGNDLALLHPEEIESMLCERRREMVYIRHVPFPHHGRARLDCLIGRDAVRVRVPQRRRAPFIDVWIVN